MVTPITRVMTENIVSVPEGTNLYEAHQLMKEKRLRHLPVINLDDKVIGIISHRDINLVEKSKNLSVEMMMSSPVLFVDYTTTLRSTILSMLEKKVSSVLIADSAGDVLGIVTTDDILWHLAHLLSTENQDRSWKSNVPDVQTIGALANSLAAAGI